jgi:hypothetical protein
MGIVNWFGNTQLLLWFFASIGVCPDICSTCGTSMNVYNPNRLEWHRDESTIPRTPEYFWWSCKAVNECLGSANRLLAASPRPRSPKVFGGFCFGTDRVTRVKLLGLHGLPSQKTPHSYTPESKRRPALIERLVKQLVHGGNKASCISESIRQAHLGLFGFSNVNRSK